MNKERIQKKMEGSVGARPGWDHHGDARSCLSYLKYDIDRCSGEEMIAHTSCVFRNVEAAFYEHQISQDEMNALKDSAIKLREEFISKCKCGKR